MSDIFKFIRKVFDWPQNKYREIHGKFVNLTPSQKWRVVWEFGNSMANLIGISVLNNCKLYWLSTMSGLLAIEILCVSLYTIYYYWNENKVSAIQHLSSTAISIPSLCLYVKAVGPARFQFRSLLLFSGRFIYRNRTPETEYEHKVDEHASKLLFHTILTVIFVTFSMSLVLIGPMYALIVHGEYTIPTGHVLPFVDASELRGYIITMIVQTFMSLCALAAVFLIEILSCMINNTYTAMGDLVCFNMRKFSDHLRQGTFSYENKIELRNILVQLQDLEAYLGIFNDIYYWKLFAQPILTTGCVSLAIFAQLENGWPSGYGFALCAYFQLLVLCYLGNGVKSVCEQIERELYAIKWYLMPPAYRKQVMSVLHRWQLGCSITIGPFEEINYEAASNLTKKIYTILMLFLTYMAK